MDASYHLTENADLTARNTFGVLARARLLAEVDDATTLPRLFERELRDTPVLVLGSGSNLLFAGDPPGAVLALTGHRTGIVAAAAATNDPSRDDVIVRADAGATWHRFFLWTLEQGLCGLENLALIPGTVGAAPIQNIGAYGVEVDQHIHAVEAFDPDNGQMQRLDRSACAFAYRDSLFKRQPDRYVVTAVEFVLSHNAAPRLDYLGIVAELEAMGINGQPSAAQVANAVTRIRQRKLPDPAVIGNAGSFFKNPIVPAGQASALQAEYPALPVFPLAPFPADAAAHHAVGAAGLRKLSAAWLIDACGWKGHRFGDAGVSSAHALVLVNHGGANGAQLLALARRIATSVHEQFGVTLQPEPRIIGGQW